MAQAHYVRGGALKDGRGATRQPRPRARETQRDWGWDCTQGGETGDETHRDWGWDCTQHAAKLESRLFMSRLAVRVSGDAHTIGSSVEPDAMDGAWEGAVTRRLHHRLPGFVDGGMREQGRGERISKGA